MALNRIVHYLKFISLIKKVLQTLILIILPFTVFSQTKSIIEGHVKDSEGNKLPFVNVVVEGTSKGVATDNLGFFSIHVTAKDSVLLTFSSVGYETTSLSVQVGPKEKTTVEIVLSTSSSELDEVSVISSHRRFGNIERINHRDIEFIPNASGSFESILKSLPGVSSSQELSSQYSVRGGNFDENLVYVNDIEIYRPFLVRSGQQEGLSFINSDMIDGVEFSAGGFNAEYGDKMSSVLNIRYRMPSKNMAKTDISLLGANGLVEGVSKNGDFTHLTGVRYKTSQYLLSSLDVSGDYFPVFLDIQSNLAWLLS